MGVELKNKDTKFMLSDKSYEFLKKLVQLILPAASSAYFALASIWGLPGAEKVVGTIAVITTFLGVTIGISAHQYEASGSKYDGTVKLVPNKEGTGVVFNIAPSDFVDKTSVTLQVVPPDL